MDGRIRTSAHITPIRRLSGGSAPLGVINTGVTRGRMEFHSRGGEGTSPQGLIPKRKNPIKKSRRKKLTRPRSQVSTRRAVLELCTKLGSQTSDFRPMERCSCGCGTRMQVGVCGGHPVLRCHCALRWCFLWCVNLYFKVHTHTQKNTCVVREFRSRSHTF